jgi:hypothetical protein
VTTGGGRPLLDFQEIEEAVERSLNLLRRTYQAGSGGSGWYHRLDGEQPGPSATAAGLAAFLLFGRQFDGLPKAVEFLTDRQIEAADHALDGGWAVNTSAGRPVTEATALVPRLLNLAGLAFVPGGPDLARACRWLLSNQNSDGGWGAFQGQQSRVWLGAMALRALAALQPTAPGVRRGVEWLLRVRDPRTQAWGELPGGSPTVTHTGFVLTALADVEARSRHRDVTDALTAGHAWLVENLVTTRIYDDDARTEAYNVSYAGSDGTQVTWQNTVWHPGLPYALSALTRASGGAHLDVLAEGVQTLLATQQPDGRWPSADSAASPSIWTVWPFLEAFADVQRLVPSGSSDVLRILSPGTVLLHRGPDRRRPLAAVLARAVGRDVGSWVVRRWAVCLLGLVVAGGGLFVALGRLAGQEYAVSLVLPVVLLVLQLVLDRRGANR